MDIIVGMPLTGFQETSFSYQGKERVVYQAGSGPGVVIMHEIPGITPQVANFARRVADAGFTAVMPNMFGTPGKPISTPYILDQILRACISKEFSVLASGQTSPITEWLRALCRDVFKRCGGKGVGAIGMCLTGGFALALMVDEAVMAPVLSQPSLPFPFTKKMRSSIDLSPEDFAIVKKRVADGCPVLGLRFTEDPACPKARFDMLRVELGKGFEAIEIDSSKGNKFGIKSSAHSVVTTDLVDQPGHPTRIALDRVLQLFQERLNGKRD